MKSVQATNYYKLFITWTNQKIKNTFVQRNMFEFQHIKVHLQTLQLILRFACFSLLEVEKGST